MSGGCNYVRSGHINGSANILRMIFFCERTSCVNASEPSIRRVITSCGVGIVRSADALALMVLGHPDLKQCDGSLFEWTADTSLPMEVG